MANIPRRTAFVLNRGQPVETWLWCFRGERLAPLVAMLEQPPKPDVPNVPDVLNRPQPVNKPIPPGDLSGDERPDTYPVPPPTDPGPPVI